MIDFCINVGLTRIQINEEWEFLNLLWEGERRRAIGATGTNRRSSRSHAIWTLYLTSSIKSDTTPAKGSGLITRTNRVHLVDLAGRCGESFKVIYVNT